MPRGNRCPQVCHRNQVERLKREKCEAIVKQREIRCRERQEYERRIMELEREPAVLRRTVAAWAFHLNAPS